jgi:hypothetical protein
MSKKFYKMTLPERYAFLLQNSSLDEDDLKPGCQARG